MPLDSDVGVEYVIDTLNADTATLIPLIAGGAAYRDSTAPGVDTKAKPGLAVSLASTTPPSRPLKTIAQSQALTPMRVQTAFRQQAASYAQIRAAANRVIALLDGKINQAFSGNSVGTMYSAELIQNEDFETNENGLRFKHRILIWGVEAKAT